MNDPKKNLRICVREIFPKKRVLRINKLRKEASSRDYYRIFLSGNKTCIAMVLNDLSSDIVHEIQDASIAFDTYKIVTPLVYRYFKNEHLMIIKDAGPVNLEAYCQVNGRKKTILVYKRIIDSLLHVHFSKIKTESLSLIPFNRCFNSDKFQNELQFFINHSELEQRLTPKTLTETQAFFATVSQYLCQQPFVLTHRDLHSRNIQIQNKEIIWIDHQDARMGPYTYDLVSLIKDSYVNLCPKTELELVAYYLENANNNWKQNLDEDTFFENYFLTLFQRSLKAAGTFFYQYKIKKNKKYKKYIPMVLKYAIIALAKIKYSKEVQFKLEPVLTQLSHEF